MYYRVICSGQQQCCSRVVWIRTAMLKHTSDGYGSSFIKGLQRGRTKQLRIYGGEGLSISTTMNINIAHFNAKFANSQWVFVDKMPLTGCCNTAEWTLKAGYINFQPREAGKFCIFKVQLLRVEIDEHDFLYTISVFRETTAPRTEKIYNQP